MRYYNKVTHDIASFSEEGGYWSIKDKGIIPLAEIAFGPEWVKIDDGPPIKFDDELIDEGEDFQDFHDSDII